MAKFPQAPGVAALRKLPPATATLPAGSSLARVYYRRSAHPLAWNIFRHFGPLNFRWDHHLPNTADLPVMQGRGIYYASVDAKSCLAEVFQATRRIDRAFQAPWLVVWKTVSALELLDLTGDFATRMGASMAANSGDRLRAQGWARDLYDAYPGLQGILYAASMDGGRPAIALNERALQNPLFPQHPDLHRALGDPLLLDPLKAAAVALGYGLR